MICLIGDLHLGRGTAHGKGGIGSVLNSRITDQYNLLDWILEQSIENYCSNIIITGDIFEDPRPITALITMFIEWLKKCQLNNIKVHIIAGNHDLLRTGTIYNSPLDIISEIEMENIWIYKDITTIEINHTAITLLPFRDRKSFLTDSNKDAIEILTDIIQYESNALPTFHSNKILIGHLAIEGSIPVGDEIDDITNELFCPISMFNDYDLVVMGHVHKPQILNKINPTVMHIGSMEMSNFSEAEHQKIIMFYDTVSGDYSNLKIPTRNLKKFTITVPKDIVNLDDFIKEEINKSTEEFKDCILKLDIDFEDPDMPSINKKTIEKQLELIGVHNVLNINENKKILINKKSSKEENKFTSSADPKEAIRLYADTFFKDENQKDLKNQYVKISLSIVDELLKK